MLAQLLQLIGQGAGSGNGGEEGAEDLEDPEDPEDVGAPQTPLEPGISGEGLDPAQLMQLLQDLMKAFSVPAPPGPEGAPDASLSAVENSQKKYQQLFPLMSKLAQNFGLPLAYVHTRVLEDRAVMEALDLYRQVLNKNGNSASRSEIGNAYTYLVHAALTGDGPFIRDPLYQGAYYYSQSLVNLTAKVNSPAGAKTEDHLDNAQKYHNLARAYEEHLEMNPNIELPVFRPLRAAAQSYTDASAHYAQLIQKYNNASHPDVLKAHENLVNVHRRLNEVNIAAMDNYEHFYGGTPEPYLQHPQFGRRNPGFQETIGG